MAVGCIAIDRFVHIGPVLLFRRPRYARVASAGFSGDPSFDKQVISKFSPYNSHRHAEIDTVAVVVTFPVHRLRRLLSRSGRLLGRSVACRATPHSAVSERFLGLVSPALRHYVRGRYRGAALAGRSLRVSRRARPLPYLRGSSDAVPDLSVLAGSGGFARKLARSRKGVRRDRPRGRNPVGPGARASATVSTQDDAKRLAVP
jgi:hypothetical protein